MISGSIDKLWYDGWQDTLLYDWDETRYGHIGYTIPETATMNIYEDDNRIIAREMSVGRPQEVELKFNKSYECHFMTPAPHLYTDKYYVSRQETIEPGEVFSAYTQMTIDPNDCMMTERNGEMFYLYTINAELQPVSWIYILQIIIVADSDKEPDVKSV